MNRTFFDRNEETGSSATRKSQEGPQEGVIGAGDASDIHIIRTERYSLQYERRHRVVHRFTSVTVWEEKNTIALI